MALEKIVHESKIIQEELDSSRHDKLIKKVIKRLNNSSTKYDAILYKCGYPDGEADLIAIYKNNALLFEMKSTDTKQARKKAKYQLRRAHNKLFGDGKFNVYKFYVYKKDFGYKINWVK